MNKVTPEYIAGFIDADGCVYIKQRKIYITNTCKEILIDISKYLTGVGIKNKIFKRKKLQVHHNDAYNLIIWQGQIEKFSNLIKLRHPHKIKNISSILNNC